jgi:hypothetical protein
LRQRMLHGSKLPDRPLVSFTIHCGGQLVNRVNCGRDLFSAVDVYPMVWKTRCPRQRCLFSNSSEALRLLVILADYTVRNSEDPFR